MFGMTVSVRKVGDYLYVLQRLQTSHHHCQGELSYQKVSGKVRNRSFLSARQTTDNHRSANSQLLQKHGMWLSLYFSRKVHFEANNTSLDLYLLCIKPGLIIEVRISPHLKAASSRCLTPVLIFPEATPAKSREPLLLIIPSAAIALFEVH